MNASFIPVRYAGALYEFALGHGSDYEIYVQVGQLAGLLTNEKSLREILGNPVLSAKVKKAFLQQAFSSPFHPDLDTFLDMVFLKRREAYLNFIFLRYTDIYRDRNNIHFGKLITAVEVNAETEEKLLGVMGRQTHGTLEIEKIVDKELIGGFVLEVDNVRWDASVAGQLKRVRKEFSKIYGKKLS